KSAKLRIASARTLRNCSVSKFAVPIIEQFLSPILTSLLESKSNLQTIDLLISLRNYFKNDTTKLTKEMIEQICSLSKDKSILEHLFLCLAEVSKCSKLSSVLFNILIKSLF